MLLTVKLAGVFQQPQKSPKQKCQDLIRRLRRVHFSVCEDRDSQPHWGLVHIPSLPLTHSWAHKHWAGKSMPVTGRPARRRVTHAENAPEGTLAGTPHQAAQNTGPSHCPTHPPHNPLCLSQLPQCASYLNSRVQREIASSRVWGQSLFTSHFFFFLWPHLQHREVPRLGVKSELQLPAYTTATATPDLSCICELHHTYTGQGSNPHPHVS